MLKFTISQSTKSLRFKSAILMAFAVVCMLIFFLVGVCVGFEKNIDGIKFILIGVLSICGIIIITLLYFLIRNIIFPINKISNAMKRMAEGDFGQHLPVQSDDEIGAMQKNFNLLSRKLLTVYELIEKINSSEDFEHTFNYVFDEFKPFIPYNRIGMALIDEETNEIRAEIARSDSSQIHLPVGYAMPIKQTSLMPVINSGQPRIINDLEEYLHQHPHSESTRLMLKEGMYSSLTLPLKINDKCIGIIFFSSTQKGCYDHLHVRFLSHIAEHLAVSFEKSILVGNLVLAAINGFAKLAESRDNETGQHIERIRDYCVVIAKYLSKKSKYSQIITQQYIRQLYDFSPLHDIGKVGIRDNILLKPGKLSSEEYEIMKKHTLIGAGTLQKAEENLKSRSKSFFSMGIEIALYHHEKYNGKGYPHGLKGEEIPLSARIVSVADVFDALTSKRPYKNPFPIDSSINIILQEKGESFDSDVVDAFIEGMNEILKIYESLSDNYIDNVS